MKRLALYTVALLIGATLAAGPVEAAATADFEVLPSKPPASGGEPPETTDRLLVRFRDRATLSARPERSDDAGERGGDELRRRASRAQEQALELVERRRAEAADYWISNTIVVEGASDTLRRELAALPEVAEVRPERRYRMERPVNAKQVEAAAAAAASTAPEWGIAAIGADRAWDQGVLGGGVVVASIDSGVEHTHPAIASQYRGNLGDGRFDHVYNWFDASSTCPGDEPCDLVGHGTHTMGTMVGGDGPGPFTPDIGVAPAAKWISPAVLIVSGKPSGVPGGKPSTGSAGKTAARIIPTPYSPTIHPPAERGRSARAIPYAAASTRSPQTTKLTVWTHPQGPLARLLRAWRPRSKPSRSHAWASPTPR